MRTSTFARSLSLLLFILSTLIFSCSKTNNGSSSSSTTDDSTAANLSSSSNSADNAYNDVLQLSLETGFDNNIAYMVSMLGQGKVQINSLHPGAIAPLGIYTCATYTVSPNDTSTFPKTITVNFGAGCTSPDGVTRKGSIAFVYTGKILYPGTTVSVSFTNYSVNGYALQGTYSISNNSSLAKGISFSTQVSNGNITFPDAGYYTYSGSKTITQTAGASTPSNLSDDVYSITGSNTIYNSSTGNTLQDSITSPLTKAEACGYISSGVVSFVFNNSLTGTLDFGNGSCDSLAIVKIGSFSENIILK
jgi:hypothetical protein